MSLEKFKKFKKDKLISINENRELWGYTRVSSKDQSTNFSLADQNDDIERLSREKNFEVTKMLGGTYESASGDFTRKEFSKLIDEVRSAKRKPYAIAIRTINRFSRSGGNAIAIVNELIEKLGVHLIETSTGLCTDNKGDKMDVFKKLLDARKENLDRLKVTLPGMKKLLISGGWLGKPPRGYTLRGKKVTDSSRIQAHQEILINDEGKHLIKAWKWKLEGERDYVILQRLDVLGIKMIKQSMSEMWGKPFYCGVSVNALLDEPAKGEWTPMISKADFLKLQDIIDGVKPASNKEYSKNKISVDRPLTGFLKCVCGAPLTSYEVKAKSLHYYKCQKCKDVSFNAVTTKKSINEGIHALFENLLLRYAIKEIYIVPLKFQLDIIFDDMNREGLDEVAALEKQITAVRIKQQRLESLYIENPDFEHEVYNRRKKEYKEEFSGVTNQLEIASRKISNHKNHIDSVLKTVHNISKIWASGDIDNKLRVQKLVFPEGLSIEPKSRRYLTTKVNSVFSLASVFTGVDEFDKNKKPTSITDGSCIVAGTGLEPVTFGL